MCAAALRTALDKPLYIMGANARNPMSKLQEEQPMSEPRKINIGGGHRSAPGSTQNVYHAGDAQAASGRTINTGTASPAAAPSDEAAAREAARRRYEQQRAASQRG